MPNLPSSLDAPSGNGRYDQLFAANPYRDLQYRQSGWQRFLSALGFRTGYDSFVEQANINAAEYDADVYAMMSENEYNSPVNQARMMRAAGLNPDLQGLGDVATSASMRNDANGMQPGMDQLDSGQAIGSAISTFARGVLSSLSIGMSLYKDLNTVKQMQSAIDGQNINNVRGLMSAVDEMIVGSVPLSVLEGGEDNLDKYANAVDWTKYGFAPNQFDGVRQMFSERLGSLKNDASLREQVFKRYTNTEGSYRSSASGFIPDSMRLSSADPEDELFDSVISSLADAAQKLNQLQRNIESNELQNKGVALDIELQHLDTLAENGYGEMQAQNEITGMSADTYTKQAQKVIAEAKSTLYSRLRALADAGNDRARVTLMAMSCNDLMQFELGGSIDFSLLKGLASMAGKLLGPKGPSYDEHGSSSSRHGFGLGFDFKVRSK